MSVAMFEQTNFTVQDATTYKGSIDADIAVAFRSIDAFAPREQDTPDMTLRLDAGFIFNAPALTAVAGQNTTTLTAPVGNPRKDIVYIDELTGAVGVATGTPAASPADPAIPQGKIPVARVSLATSTTTITNALIDDLRTGTWRRDGDVKGADIASATNVTVPAVGEYFAVTGTTNIETLTARSGGRRIKLKFNAALTLVHSSALILQDAINRPIAAGDVVDLTSDDGSNWRQTNLWPAASGTLPGAVFLAGVITPTTVTANTNDYAPTGGATASTWRLATDAARNFTGFAGGAKGRRLTVPNVGAAPFTLKHENTGSAAANRFRLGGADLVLNPDQTVVLYYDATVSRWRPESITSQTGNAAYPNETVIVATNHAWPVPAGAQKPGVLITPVGAGGGSSPLSPGAGGQAVTVLRDLTGVATVDATLGDPGTAAGGADPFQFSAGPGGTTSFGSYAAAKGGNGASYATGDIDIPGIAPFGIAAAMPGMISLWTAEAPGLPVTARSGPLGETGANSGAGGAPGPAVGTVGKIILRY